MENPEDEDDGTKICTHGFDDLTSAFPDTTLGDQATIVNYIVSLTVFETELFDRCIY